MARHTLRLAPLIAVFCSIALADDTRSDSLYERLGGSSTVSAIVSDSIDALAAVPGKLRQGHDLREIKSRLVTHICARSGGGCAPHDGGFGLAEADFLALVEQLRASMRAHAVPLAARNELLEVLAPMRRDVARLRASG